MADRLGVAFLGAIPLTTAIRRASDAGRPVVVAAPDSAPARAFFAVAEKITSLVGARPEGADARPQVTF